MVNSPRLADRFKSIYTNKRLSSVVGTDTRFLIEDGHGDSNK